VADNLSRKAPQKNISVKDAKARVLELIAQGFKVEEAMSAVNRKTATYLDWRKNDKEFASSVDGIRQAKAQVEKTGRPAVPDFPEFCAEWLKQPLFPHQLRMYDVIEGREPRDMHDSMTYRAGDPQRVLINVPPEHAKSTTFTVNYSVWRIHKDPTVRIVIMSQTRGLAQKFLYEIKQKLTSPLYREMHLRFAPDGGDWKDKDQSWTNDLIYVSGKNVDGIQKDPTVQAMGLTGQIYGQRADLIFLDDIITTKNVREIDKQKMVLDREIESRLPSAQEGGGLLAILGTRVSPQDLYRTLIDEVDGDDDSVWTYFRQPAVLDYGDGGSSTWKTLWPEKWNGKSLARRKRGAAAWNLIYQQLNVDDEMTFHAEAVEASINGGRFPGLLTTEGVHHREGGMQGLYVIAGLDPATVGATAMLVIGLDPLIGKRYILDGFNQSDCPPHVMREKMQYFTETYSVNEWVIERNAYQRSITQDKDLINYLRAHGCKLTEHTTGTNKFDSDFGIATMGPLFDTCGEPDPKSPSGRWKRTPNTALIELPSDKQNQWVQQLRDQLVIWQPEGMAQKQKTDLVMALWFCEIAAKKILNRQKKKTHFADNPFQNSARKRNRSVISLADMRRQKQEAEIEAAG